QLVKAMLKRRIQVNGARVLVMGLTFKENCPDLRNTRVVDVVAELKEYGIEVDIHDPWADPAEAAHEYCVDLKDEPAAGDYDGIILAVAHRQFADLGGVGIRMWGRPEHVLYDLKNVLAADESDL